MSGEFEILIDANGDLQYVYDDALAPLAAEGQATVRRASHVEPHPTKPGWVVDLRPVRGMILDCGGNGQSKETTVESPCRVEGWEAMSLDDLLAALEQVCPVIPFPTREAALHAERTWLSEQMARGRVEVR